MGSNSSVASLPYSCGGSDICELVVGSASSGTHSVFEDDFGPTGVFWQELGHIVHFAL